jgi:hypothetical protein
MRAHYRTRDYATPAVECNIASGSGQSLRLPCSSLKLYHVRLLCSFKAVAAP